MMGHMLIAARCFLSVSVAEVVFADVCVGEPFAHWSDRGSCERVGSVVCGLGAAHERVPVSVSDYMFGGGDR